jgi:anti-sigma regulatory factor (Ser/Thr protein kinase)
MPVRDLIDAYPWQETPLGPRATWDPTLAAAVGMILGSPVPMALACGDDLVFIYNDGYAELLGDAHPAALGQRGPADAAVEEVHRTGQPVMEAVRGHSALRGADGRTVAVLTVAAETTQANRRLRTLGQLTTALAAAVTLDDVARVTLRFALAALDVDHAGFAADDGRGWRTVRRHRRELLDEDDDERLPPVWHRLPAQSPEPVVRAATDDSPLFLSGSEVGGAAFADSVKALAALPLRTRSLRGGITVGYERPHDWLPAERATLTGTADLVAQAAERARLFETQHGTAQLLQRSMLPQALPSVAMFRVAARYEPGVDGNAAGGDFYDAFVLPGRQFAVVLGDVAGHDVRAAAVMGQVRAGLRTMALTDSDPSAVLAAIDRLVFSIAGEAGSHELFVTVVYAVADPDARTLNVASAGHPPPLLRRPGAPTLAEFVDTKPGPPLGVGGGVYPTVTTKLTAGDTVLLFSDGVVERRDRPIDEGLATLAAAVSASVSGDPRNLCAVVTNAVTGSTDDDVAALALEYAATPSRVASLDLPAEATMPARTRRWLSQQLGGWGVPDETVHVAMLCVSELTTNALLHAGTPTRIDIDLSDERLLIAVSDSGTRGRAARSEPEALSTRGRGLNLVAGLADAWGSEPTVRGSTVWFELLLRR